ncbi:C4-dicarboxylate TRAP transporter substrate-binding protein [Chloroflexota bacterium]
MGYEWWAEQVTARTGGAVKFEHFYNEALGGAKTAPEDMRAGLYDLAVLQPPWYAAKLPMIMIGFLPAVTTDEVVLGKAMSDLVTQVPEFESDFFSNRLKLLAFYGSPSAEYMGTKPIKSVADINGLKIRASGDLAKIMDKLGATIVSMPSPESYEAIQRGTIDGAFLTYPASFGSYSIHEVAQYATIIGAGPVAIPIVMGLNTFNLMEPRVQAIMLEEAARMPEKYVEIFKAEDAKWLAAFEEAGIEITEFTAAQKAEVRSNAQERWEAWVENIEGKGMPGQRMLDTLLAAVEKYSN